MIPLRDNNPRRTVPFVTYTLIALNVLAFFWQLSLGQNLERALFQIAFIPARFWIPGAWVFDLFTVVVSMFLHGSLMHIGSNMLYLFIFGDNIEDRLGHGRYLVFYLLCGFLATYAHAIFSPGSRIPAIGASGAIAGVLGAYLLLFPHAKVMTLLPIFVFIMIRELPAIFILGFWFVLQLFSSGRLPRRPRRAGHGRRRVLCAHRRLRRRHGADRPLRRVPKTASVAGAGTAVVGRPAPALKRFSTIGGA